jgi:copper chaperone CopZ
MTDTASAREEVMKCEQEIHAIKAALRRVGTTASSSTTDAEQNSMEIVLLKVKGNPIFLSLWFICPKQLKGYLCS